MFIAREKKIGEDEGTGNSIIVDQVEEEQDEINQQLGAITDTMAELTTKMDKLATKKTTRKEIY